MEEENNYITNNNIDDSEKLNYEEMRNKLIILEANNQKINDQLFSLQNKFYVQTKILNDKNSELSKEKSQKEKFQRKKNRFNYKGK